jgi:hypothetical protein
MTSQAHDAIVGGAGSIGRPTTVSLDQAGLKPTMAKGTVRRAWRGLYRLTLAVSLTVGWVEELRGYSLAELSPDRGLGWKEALA